MPSTISAGTTAGTAIAIAGDTTGNLAFQTNGTTTAMTVDTSQNVGIGTASPAYRLDVLNSAVDGGVRITGGGSGANLFLNNNATGGRNYRVYSTGSLNAVGAGYLGFFDETAGLFRMGIDSSGRVLMPYQPAFSASKSGNQSISSVTATKITLDQTSFNTGSNFNTSTNRFTAPVAGRYLFTAAVQFTGAVGQPHSAIVINGTALEPWLDWGASVLTAAFQSRVVNLAANDYVELFTYITTSGTASGPRSVLSGYLIG